MVYVDDGIFMGPEKQDIDTCIQDMKGIFDLTDKGDILDYLGIKVTKLANSCISLCIINLLMSRMLDNIRKLNR